MTEMIVVVTVDDTGILLIYFLKNAFNGYLLYFLFLPWRENRAQSYLKRRLKCNPLVLAESKEGKCIFEVQQRNMNISKRNAI